MNVSNNQEIWQIDVGGQIYEASFDEMTQWIFEGALLPQDLVKRGNLRWIEARKVPLLTKLFEAKEQGMPPPVVQATPGASTDGQPAAFQSAGASMPPAAGSDGFSAPSAGTPVHELHGGHEAFAPGQEAPKFGFNNAGSEQNVHQAPPPQSRDVCSIHPDAPSKYLCEGCACAFCKACPKSFGGSVKICPFCGAMCHPVGEVKQKAQRASQFQSAVTEGFGFGDFGTALAYPFRFKASLFFGAVLFMFFSLGQGAAAMGGLYLAAAAIICWMLSNMLTFGVLANTIDNFTQGNIGVNFMPSFDDFSLWDDVVHPLFLSIAVHLVSFGLLIVLVLGFVWYTLNAIASEIKSSGPASQMRILTDEDSPLKKNSAIDEQGELYGDGEMPDEERMTTVPFKSAADEEEEFRRLNEMINQHRKEQLESTFGKTPETEAQEFQGFVSKILAVAGPFLILAVIFMLWGIFYFPAACAVAGYTRSFWATMNPSIGLETIKILGIDYLKIWLMGFLLAVMSGAVGLVLAAVFSPFDLPKFGNLPAKAVGAMFGFYFSVVFSCVLGYALYKNADRLRLFKG